MKVRTKSGAARFIRGLGVVKAGKEWTEFDDEQVAKFEAAWPGRSLEDFGLEVFGQVPTAPPTPPEPETISEEEEED